VIGNSADARTVENVVQGACVFCIAALVRLLELLDEDARGAALQRCSAALDECLDARVGFGWSSFADVWSPNVVEVLRLYRC
jgi:hypothetical protein